MVKAIRYDINDTVRYVGPDHKRTGFYLVKDVFPQMLGIDHKYFYKLSTMFGVPVEGYFDEDYLEYCPPGTVKFECGGGRCGDSVTLEPLKAPAMFLDSFYRFKVKDIIFNNPATIIFWKDGTKTVVKCSEEEEYYDPMKGIALCFMKKALGNKGNYNDIFRKYIKEDEDAYE